MAKKEKKKQRPTPGADLKKILIISAILLITIPIGLFTLFPEALYLPWIAKVQIEGQMHNDAKDLAQIMSPFAQKYHLTQIDENSNPRGISNLASYSYTYKGNQSMNEMKELISQYLTEKGYNMKDELAKEANVDGSGNFIEGEPWLEYWRLEGSNDKRAEVYVDVKSGKVKDVESIIDSTIVTVIFYESRE